MTLGECLSARLETRPIKSYLIDRRGTGRRTLLLDVDPPPQLQSSWFSDSPQSGVAGLSLTSSGTVRLKY